MEVLLKNCLNLIKLNFHLNKKMNIKFKLKNNKLLITCRPNKKNNLKKPLIKKQLLIGVNAS